MGTHRAAWVARIGVIGVLVAAGLAIGAGPASAAGITIDPNPDSLSLTVGGGKATTTVTLMGMGDGAVSFKLTGVTGYGAGFSDTVAGCNVGANTITCSGVTVIGSKGFDITVGAPAQSGLPAGQSVNGKIEVTYNPGGGGKNVTKDIPVTLTGSARGGVIGVAGTVTDANAAPVSDAVVKVTDSADKVKSAITGATGEFVIDAQSDPFKPGNITIAITKSGFTSKTITRTGVAGQPITLDVKLAASTSATPSATPSASASQTDQAPPAGNNQAGNAQAGKGNSGLGALTWILLILGFLLVVGGGLAIFFLLRKGKDDDGLAGPTPTVYGSPPGPTAHGGPGNTRLMPAADDSPTMMHQGPLVTDDPYGSPPDAGAYGYPGQSDPRYAEQTRAYGGHDLSQGYGQRTDQYGAPADPYAAPVTQQYRPAADPYAAPATEHYGHGQPAGDPHLEQNRAYGAEQPTQQFRPEQRSQPPRQPDRRPLEWLDD